MEPHFIIGLCSETNKQSSSTLVIPLTATHAELAKLAANKVYIKKRKYIKKQHLWRSPSLVQLMPVETCQSVREDSSGRKNNYLQNYWIVVVIISLSQSTIYNGVWLRFYGNVELPHQGNYPVVALRAKLFCGINIPTGRAYKKTKKTPSHLKKMLKCELRSSGNR